MALSPENRRRVLLGFGALALLAVVAALVWLSRPRLPAAGTPAYEGYVDALEVGIAALDAGLHDRAEENLNKAVASVPGEPAGWANRALLYLRLPAPDLANARSDLERARKLAPNDPDIEAMFGFLAEREGNLQAALDHYRKSYQATPENLQRAYQVVELLNREGGEFAAEEQEKMLLEISKRRPTNLHVLIRRLDLALRRGDAATAKSMYDQLDKLAPRWSSPQAPDARRLLAGLRPGLAKKFDPATTGLDLQMLNNLCRAEAGYATAMEELNPATSMLGTPIHQFLKLDPLRTQPSKPDLDLTIADRKLTWQPDVVATGARWDVILPVWLNETAPLAVFVGNAKEVRRADGPGASLAFPAGPKAEPPGMHGVLAIDWNNDHRTDLLLAGAGGLRFNLQQADGSFADVTAKTKLTAEVLAKDWFGAWAVDIDFDGDLDVVLAARTGPATLLRNNGDGTFLAQPIFDGTQNMRSFAWADLDNDGAADAILLAESGELSVFMNERAGQFRQRAKDPMVKAIDAIAVADVNDDGLYDVVALAREGLLRRITLTGETGDLGTARIATPRAPGTCRLVAVDLDNSGTIDFVLRTKDGGVAWLKDENGGLTELRVPVPPGTADVVSLAQNDHFDFLGLDKQGQPVLGVSNGTKGYHWQDVRPVATVGAAGDQRINSFALGGDVELRSGTLYVKQPIARPVVHFGLGERQKASVLRFTWTNGAAQYEFDLPPDAVHRVEQRLKGSCPFLFTWDGQRVVFVSDFCWSTPLGLYINAQKRGGGFVETTEWIKIPGDKLAARDGLYDVRVNANLWETHYLDQLALHVVDHPPGTEVFCDERFFLTPTKPRLYVTETPRPVAKALDHHGDDVTNIVRSVDGEYLDRAGRGRYQGVTNDHWVEVDLGDDVPTDGPVYLIATGWLRPTDSSINAALGQSSHDKPRPLSLEVPDGKGGWKTALPGLGFLAGKNKTMVLRLDGIDGPGVARRFRLRTNMEIYWDALRYARGADPAQVLQKVTKPRGADLRFRGILHMEQKNRSSPELPVYDRVFSTGQVWRDLIGFHTRFGPVEELVEKVDDRYVILNAGDEILLRFAEPLPPPAGWKRDFVWVSDGWTKDGDLNTRFGKTVLPLPYHGMGEYDTPPGRLEDDPVYRKHRRDWKIYHTRYVTPAAFERGLRGNHRPSSRGR